MKTIFSEFKKNLRAHYTASDSLPFLMTMTACLTAAALTLSVRYMLSTVPTYDLYLVYLAATAALFSLILPFTLSRSLRADLLYNQSLFGTPYRRGKAPIILARFLSDSALALKSYLTGALPVYFLLYYSHDTAAARAPALALLLLFAIALILLSAVVTATYTLPRAFRHLCPLFFALALSGAVYYLNPSLPDAPANLFATFLPYTALTILTFFFIYALALSKKIFSE